MNKKEREIKELEEFFTNAELATEPKKPDLHNPDVDLFLDDYLSVSDQDKPSFDTSHGSKKQNKSKMVNLK